jgi:hypothetical protein
METLGNDLVAFCGNKMANNYFCDFCDYKCSKKYNWEKHLMTSKHIREITGNGKEMASGKKWQKEHKFSCEHCDRLFISNSGLWKHKTKGNCAKNTCKQKNETGVAKYDLDKDKLIEILLKENSEFKSMLMEQQSMMMKVIENGTHNNSHNTTNTNSHNAFNLNFFLNETCKNAMNMTDFMESINLELPDLLAVGKVGYVEGISNIIINKLKALDETVRPIHCTDKKREIFYVKDADIWEKEEEDLKKLRKLIKKVSYKNEKLLFKYKAEHPGCNFSESKFADEYSKLVIEAMGGEGDNDKEKQDKIIRNISKVTTVTNKK